MVVMDEKNHDKGTRAGDCPQCGGDSKGVKLLADGIHELRQCFDEPTHRFESEAVFDVPFKDATIIPH
ncbi:hypothetical protein PXH69_29130 [Rhodococcus qingshengii]|uniref:Uncharacterized protein n=1 Tax=Rhodococcus qingshengii TaxID=334542 RepID=A0AAW6LV98_RHOSG|nr:hypothetical protein [Rhodococcus qingshengii]MDE8649042.1 hypothetical protein [Rhodococcus qingshengii]